MASPAKLTLKIGGELSASFRKSIRAAQTQVSTFSQNVKRSVNDAAGGAAKGFKNVIRNDAFQAAAVGAAALGTGLTKAVRTAADFQSGMLKVKAISGANEEQFKSLTSKAKELGRTTQFSARQASDAMGFLAMAGYDTNQILSATPQMMNLAAAGGLELGEAADIASNILGGMGLQIEDTAMVTDVLAKAAASGNTNIQMMGEAFKYVAPTAAQAGASIQDMGGAMALLGNSGIQASVAGTGLRSVLLNLSGANESANKAMARLNIQNKDAAGNMRPLADILGDVEKAMDGANLGTAERMELQKQLFGKTAVATGSILQEAAANGELAAMVAKVTDSQGAAADMAKTMNAGFEGSMKRLASAAEGLMISFGTPLLAPLANVAEALAGILAPVAGLLTDMPILGVAVGAVAAAFVGFVVVLPILGAISGAMGALGITAAGMWAAVTGPVGIAVVAIIGVIAAFQLLYNKVGWFRDGVDAIINELKFLWSSFSAGIQSAFTAAVGYITPIFEAWKTSFMGVVQVVQGIWQVFTGIFTGDSETAVEGVKNIFGGLKAWFGGFVDGLKAIFAPAAQPLIDAFNSAVTFLQPVIDGIGAIFDGLVLYLQGIWKTFTSLLTGDFQGAADGVSMALEGLKGIFGTIIGGLKLLWDGLVTHVKGIGTQIVDTFLALPGKLKEVGGAIIDTIKEGFMSRFNALKDTVVNSFQEIRKLLPFSDAKKGPFKDLTYSGRALVETISKGIRDRQGVMSSAMASTAEGAMATLDNALGKKPALEVAAELATVPMAKVLSQGPQQKDRTPARQGGGNALAPLLGGLLGIAGAAFPQAQPFMQPAGQLLSAVLPRDSGPIAAAPSPGGGATGRAGAATISPTVNITVTNSNASPEDIALAVSQGLEDALGEAEAGTRALLND